MVPLLPPPPFRLGASYTPVARRSDIFFFSSSRCNLAINRSATSRTTFPPSLPHGSAVRFQLQTTVGRLSWSLSVNRKTAREGYEPAVRWPTWSRVCSIGYLRRHYPTLGNRHLVYRTIASAKTSRCFRMVVSMLSHFVLLRTLAYERLAWLTRRWKPRTRRRTSRCVNGA